MKFFKDMPYVLITCIGLFIIACSTTAIMLYQDFRLSAKGQETVARVEFLKSRHKSKQGRETFYHAITFDGHYATLGLDSSLPSGTQIDVTYLPSEPDSVSHGRLANKPPSDILFGKAALLGYLICIVTAASALLNVRSRNIKPN